MLYVSNILRDDNLVEVTDTDDGVSEKIPMSELLGLVSKGLEVSGVFDNQVRICSGDWLEEEFFQYCVKKVYAKFRKTGFRNDAGLFSYLYNEFSTCFKSVKDINKTPVVSCGMHRFTADCIGYVCSLSGVPNIVEKSGRISSTALDNIYTKVYINLGIVVYISLKSHRRSYKIVYSD